MEELSMLTVKNLTKVYKTKGGANTKALDDVSIDFPKTGMVFLLGKSGSGKSTLLNVIGGLDKVDSGEIIIKGKNSKDFTNGDFDSYRNTYIGFIFQEYNILNEFNVEQNISLALELQNKKNDKEAINKILEQVDLKGFNKRKPNTLSGGQKQRIAIARALIKSPEIIMADEPSGALDSNTGKQVFETLKKLSKEKLVIIVSHDRDFAEVYGDRIIELSDGKIIRDVEKESKPAEKISDNIDVINNNIITIKNSNDLVEKDIKYIINKLKEKSGEVIISTNQENNNQIREVTRIGKDGTTDIFLDTKNVEKEEYDASQTKFIKSHLPLPRAIKMGASGLKIKPFRLMFTILLSVTSFTMFGVLSTLMLYDEAYSIKEAMRSSSSNTEQIIKNMSYRYDIYNFNTSDYSMELSEKGDTYTSRAKFTVSELNNLNNSNNDLYFVGTISFVQPSQYYQYNNSTLEFTNNFSGTNNYFANAKVNSISDQKDAFDSNYFSILQGNYPASSNEILIPQYIFEAIKNQDNLITNYSDIIGKQYSVYIYGSNNSTTQDFTISGVYDAKEMPFNKDTINGLNYDDKSLNDFKDYLKHSFHTLCFVSEDFYTTYKDIVGEYDDSLNDNNYLYDSSIYFSGSYSYMLYLTEEFLPHVNSEITFYDLDGNKIEGVKHVNQTEICIPLNYKDSVSSTYTITSYKGSLDVNVVGYYELDTQIDRVICYCNKYIQDTLGVESNTSLIAKTITNYQNQDDAYYSSLLCMTDYSQKDINIFLKENKSEGYEYKMTNGTYNSLNMWIEMVKEDFQKLFVILGIIFGVFAALMLANFISISISNKTKEIGILRAVGARGNDVFRIFYSESCIIALICSILGSAASIWVCGLLNNKLGATISLRLLNFTPINFLLLVAIALIISAISTFLPVLKASRKPPVESIRSL